jgi:hypothetical protein
MDNIISKICKKCGPLTKDKCRFRIQGSRHEIICKLCDLRRIKEYSIKNKEKIKLWRQQRAARKREQDVNHIKELHCNKCDKIKAANEFHNNMLLIRFPICKECRNLLTKIHHHKPESKKKHKQWFQEKYEPIARNAQYLKKYGITLEQFEKMSEQQNHLCLICKKPETHTRRKDGKCFLHVDHCHLTGKVRGLLCLNCNVGLGKFSDSREMLLMAVAYLESYSS